MREFAPAKVNLFLHVGLVNEAGRHPLDSLTVFADRDAADTLEADLADELSLTVDGPFAEPAGPIEDNLVMRAARALSDHVGVSKGASLRLTKRLPVAAGIGGGSADAGAALRLLPRLWGIDAKDACREIAARLGGDVPAAYRASPVMMRGEGERVEPIVMPAPIPALLVNPGVACPTGAVFRRYDADGGGGGFDETEPPELIAHADVMSWLARTRNDLEPPAIALAPEIGTALDALDALPGVRLARMSGSGATCFGIFDTLEAAMEARDLLKTSQPNWWAAATRFAPA